MFVAYAVVGIVLSLVLLASARAKLVRDQRVTESLTGAGVPLRAFPFLAACEIAGAAGLLVGLWLGPLGVAAAIGLVLYFVGAVGAHLRRGDVRGMPPAAVILVISVVALVLRALTL